MEEEEIKISIEEEKENENENQDSPPPINIEENKDKNEINEIIIKTPKEEFPEIKINQEISELNNTNNINNININQNQNEIIINKEYDELSENFSLINIDQEKLTGTARYASINALKGYEQSRRDDLESAGYVLMYFLKGALPWQGIPGKTKDERYKKILQKKMDTSAEVLCEGFPEEFRKYIEYTRNLDYEETPDYENLRDYFLNVLEKQNEDLDYIYIWSTEQEKILRKKEYLEEKEKEKRKK